MKRTANTPRDTIVEIFHFNSDPFDSALCTAKMSGCSASGVHFIADRQFSKDTPVHIRLKNGDGTCHGSMPAENVRASAVGWVKRSRPVNDDKAPRFEIEVQYCR